MIAAFKPLLVLPSYNTGPILVATVTTALQHAHPHPVWVVLDGSTDTSETLLRPLIDQFPNHLRLLVRPSNGGKGQAILDTLAPAQAAGFTHLLSMDADGQHPPAAIAKFFHLGLTHPDSLIMGHPIFGQEAPSIRVKGHAISLWFTDLETPGANLGDPLFGMRLYPLAGLIAAFAETRFARRYDFDVEIAVRMTWLGYRPRQLPVPVRYLSQAEGGVSHFHYVRDNLFMVWLHARLLTEFFLFRHRPFFQHRKAWQTADLT
jgi:glycosyltransferase involved in cell wall biosynthesis